MVKFSAPGVPCLQLLTLSSVNINQPIKGFNFMTKF